MPLVLVSAHQNQFKEGIRVIQSDNIIKNNMMMAPPLLSFPAYPSKK